VTDCGTGGAATQVEAGQDDQAGDAGRHAAGREPPHDLPLDSPGKPVDERAAGLGRGRVKQIGADSRGRMDTEQQYQQRCHERPAADTGHPDQKADGEPRSRIQQFSRNPSVHRDGPGAFRFDEKPTPICKGRL
jgi:hypothetical protein